MIIDAISGVGGGSGTQIVQKPTVVVGTYTYDGTAQGPTITGLDTQNTIVTNATATNAGTYTLTIALKNSAKMVWNDMTTADLVYTYTISKATLTVPTVTDTTKTYNGSAQSPTITGFDSTTMTKTGDSATDAGNYTITFGLVDSTNYEWNTTNTVNWSIEKADQTITLSSNSVTLDSEHLTATVTVSGAQGAISVTSSASSVATASVSGSTITISNVNETTGSATITVSVAGTTNYNPATDSTISVSAQFANFLTDWLTAGGLNPASYADLDAVLADESAVRKLFTIHDAVDVIVDEVSIISSSDLTKIFNDNYVAKWVNLRDYALDTLYANSTIAGYMDTADKYFYGEWVITDSTTTPVTWGPKGNVPVMTSDTAPYGEAFAKDYESGYNPYKVFDGDYATFTYSPNASVSDYEWYIGYKFTNPVCVKEVKSIIAKVYSVASGTIKIQGSNDGSTWTDVITGISYNTSDISTDVDISIPNNTNYYLYYRFHTTGLAPAIRTLQFYGREMKVSVPTMTSNTTPSGEASCSTQINVNYPAWKAFNGDETQVSQNGWQSSDPNTLNDYLQYEFPQKVKGEIAKVVFQYNNASDPRLKKYKITASNDGTNWVDVSDVVTAPTASSQQLFTIFTELNTSQDYKYYRLQNAEQFNNSLFIIELQFFGFDYSEYDWDTVKPRHYIYDHGIEFETITKSTNGSRDIEKRSDSIYMMGDNSSYLGAQVASIDLTNYSLFRVVIGKIYGGASHSLGVDSNNTAYVMLSDSGINPNNLVLNIENVNSTHQIVITGDNGTSSIGYLDFVEWWLE